MPCGKNLYQIDTSRQGEVGNTLQLDIAETNLTSLSRPTATTFMVHYVGILPAHVILGVHRHLPIPPPLQQGQTGGAGYQQTLAGKEQNIY